ncbi:MAG: hypothetical protein LBC64_09600 [Fibromonadaceae bacterium]|nr:hypothetical protein [Fibromonadaceae bacterium]
MVRFLIGAFFVILVSCTPVYNLTDRSGNVFVIESPEVETKGNWEYRTGNAIRELHVNEIVSLSVPNAEPKIFDGRIFYPATLTLEDTVSVPPQGFICIEGELKADNAGKRITIHLSNVKELIRQKKEEKPNASETAAAEPTAVEPAAAEPSEGEPQEGEQPQEGTGN